MKDREGKRYITFSDIATHTRRGVNKSVDITKRSITYIVHMSQYDVDKTYKKLSQDLIYKRLFKHKHYNIPMFFPVLVSDDAEYPPWMLRSLQMASQSAAIFSEIRNRIEYLFSHAEYSIAYDELKKFEENNGVSMWSTLETIKILYHLHDTDIAKEYANTLKDRCASHVGQMTLDYCIIKHESKNINNFKAILKSITEGFKGTEVEWFPSLLSCYLLPREHDPSRSTKHIPVWLPTMSIFDQLYILELALTEQLIDDDFPKTKEWTNSLAQLKKIKNKEIQTLISTYENPTYNYGNATKEILNLYSCGKYTECAEKIITNLQEDPSNICLAEVHAKSEKYSGASHIFTGNRPCDKIFTLVSDAIRVDKGCTETLSSLKTYITKLHPSNISTQGLAIYYSLFQDYNKQEREISKSRAIFQQAEVTPKLVSPTADEYAWYYDQAVINLCECEQFVPEQRALKRIFHDEIRKDTPDISHLTALLEKIKTASATDDHEIDRLEFNFIEKTKGIFSAAQFLVQKCVKNIERFRCFPLGNIVDRIGTEHDTHDTATAIELPILYHIYITTIDSAKTMEMREAYDDFMQAHGTHEPSTIFHDAKIDELAEYFLLHVCTPSTMDISIEFSSSAAILSERIKIIDILIKKIGHDPSLVAERKRTMDNIIIDQSMAGIDSSKIFVDTNHLKENRWQDYLWAFQTLKNTTSTDSEKTSEFYEFLNSDNKTGYLVPRGERNEIVTQIIRMMSSDFVSHTAYGLNKYLSAEIRHGRLVNLLRSIPEKNKLITNKINNEYLPNKHWTQPPFPQDAAMEQVAIDAFKSFSKNYDTLLIKCRDWMHITVSENEPDKLFNYAFSPEEFEDIKSRLDAASIFEKFFEELIDFFWEKTEKCIAVVQKRIHEEFKKDALSCYDNLKTALAPIYPAIDISPAIEAAKRETLMAITTISTWIQRRPTHYYGSLEIGKLIQVSISCFKSMRNGLTIDFATTADDNNEFSLSEKEASPFVTALMTAFDNAVIGCTARPIPRIDITTHYSNHEATIVISNKYDRHTLGMPPEVFFEQKNRQLSDRSREDLVTSEGGSGIYKINAILKQASPLFNVKIAEDPNDTFKVIITREHNENTNH